MAESIFQYPLDLTGKATTNNVTFPIKLAVGKTKRAFAFPAGAFYADSFEIRIPGDFTTKFFRGKDYELIITDPRYQRETKNKEICHAVVITNNTIGDSILASAQIVGGPNAANVPEIERALNDAKLDSRRISFLDLQGVPETLPGAPAYKDLGDLFGFEYIIAELAGLREAINAGDSVQLEQMLAAVERLAATFLEGLNHHASAEGNVHNANPHQIGTLTQEEIRELISGVTNQINQVSTEIEELKASDGQIATQLTAFQSAMQTWQRALDQVNLNYQNAQQAVANAVDLVAKLNKRVTEQQQEIDTLKNRCAALETAIQQINTKLSQLESVDSTHNQQIAANASAITALDQKLTNHTAANDPHPNYLHKTIGGTVQANVHLNATLSTRDDVQAEAGSR